MNLKYSWAINSLYFRIETSAENQKYYIMRIRQNMCLLAYVMMFGILLLKIPISFRLQNCADNLYLSVIFKFFIAVMFYFV